MIALTSILALTTLFSTYVLGFVALFLRITRMPLMNFIVASKSDTKTEQSSKNLKMQNCLEDTR